MTGETHGWCRCFAGCSPCGRGWKGGAAPFGSWIVRSGTQRRARDRNKFTPGFTSYYHRIQVQRYEVTSLLHEGENRWQTTVGDGWWRWNNNFGWVLALWGELALNYTDGTVQTIVTDTDFAVGTGAILPPTCKAARCTTPVVPPATGKLPFCARNIHKGR